MKNVIRTFLISTLMLIVSSYVHAQTTGKTDTEGSVFRWQGDGLKFETAARPALKVLAFYMGRGFSADTAKALVDEGCIFRSAIGSDEKTAGGKPVSVDLNDWRVIVNGKAVKIRKRNDWDVVLDRLNVKNGAARIAFKWSLFPPKQTFLVGDYNWGLLSFTLPPKTRFDLKIVWRLGGQKQTQTFKGLECGS